MHRLQSGETELWLLVEWKDKKPGQEAYELISDRQLKKEHRTEDLYTGKVVSVVLENKSVRRASIVIVSADRTFIEMEFKHMKAVTVPVEFGDESTDAGKPKISVKRVGSSESDNGDFEASDTDWLPNNSESENDENQKKKRRLSFNERKRLSTTPKLTGHKKYYQTHSRVRISDTLHKKLNPPKSPSENDQQATNPEISAGRFKFFDPSIFEGSLRLHSNFKDINEEASTSKTQIPPMTFDQQTQTDNVMFDEATFNTLLKNQKLLRTEMIYFYKAIDDIKKQMNAMNKTMKNVENLQTVCENNTQNGDLKVYDYASPVSESNFVLREANYTPAERKVNKANSASNSGSGESTPESKLVIDIDGAEMVPIGSGKTLIPRHIYNQIKWNSYTFATRKLLMAVFPRRTLATHSLTGKSSPAFTNRPAKMKLDAKKISDIVMTVSQMCNVQENFVRNTITTKCSDENKMYRIRQKKMKNKNGRENDINQENKDPEIEESEMNE